MPAVNTFAIYATVAMTFNFILQTTTFVALLTVDQSRYRVRLLLFKSTFRLSQNTIFRATGLIFSAVQSFQNQPTM